MDITEQEQAFAEQLNSRYAVMFGVARHALIGILESLGARPGHEVILPSVTCKVVPLAILSMGLKPVYADVRVATLNLDPAAVEQAITPATRAILFQHTYGQSQGIHEIAALAENRSIPLLEDCAHCMPYIDGAESPGHWGTAAVFSNNLRKPLPSGSGGLAITDDAGLAGDLVRKRNSFPSRGTLDGIRHRFEMFVHRRFLGPKTYWPLYELKRKLGSFYHEHSLASEIDAEVGASAYRISAYQIHEAANWIPRIEAIVDHRRMSCAEYTGLLRGVRGIELPFTASAKPLYFYPVLVDRKKDLLLQAKQRNLEMVAWPMSTPIYPVQDTARLSAYGYQSGSCPGAEDVARRLVGLPTNQPVQTHHRAAIAELIKDHHRLG